MTMKKMMVALAVVTGLVLALGTQGWSDEKGGKKTDKLKEKAAMAATAKVTIDQAIKVASEKVQGTVIETELERKHGKLVWEVEIVTPENKIMEVHVDAESGTVIDVEEKQAEKERKRERKRDRQP